MIQNNSVLAVITARGGSKGVPGKNIKLLSGKPLIVWSIESALASSYVDRVLVTTDSPEIRKVALDAGADAPFLRPAHLASDLSKQEDAIMHAMQWCEISGSVYDYLMVLVPTTPLRDTLEIDTSIELLYRHDRARAIFTVRECDHSPLQANVLPEDGCMNDFISDDLKFKNRQELPTYYQLSGSVCLSEWEWFKKHQSFLTPLTYAYVTSARKGLDIDNICDFMLAEAYLDCPGLG